MITPGGNAWLITLTDLSLILFMITAGALAQSEPKGTHGRNDVAAVAMAEPVAIFRPDGNPDALKQWLANQAEDPRQRLTIRAVYSAGGEAAAADRAIRLAQEARADGREPRIVLESGKASDIAVSLAYDSTPSDVAQQLHPQKRNNMPEKQQ